MRRPTTTAPRPRSLIRVACWRRGEFALATEKPKTIAIMPIKIINIVNGFILKDGTKNHF
jgi:hypothetical protein